jgi:hypothetical protein
MIMLCGSVDDNHMAGPHRIVVPVSRKMVYTGRDKKREVMAIVGEEYVICANCDHWIQRYVQNCGCTCHNQHGTMRQGLQPCQTRGKRS